MVPTTRNLTAPPTPLYKRSVHGSKLTTTWRRETKELRPRRQRLPSMISVTWWWWCFLYCQTDELHKPGYWRELYMYIHAMMLVSLCSLMKTRWCYGLSTVLDCSMSSFSAQTMSFLSSLQLPVPSLYVRNPDQQSTLLVAHLAS